jgi:hypothetical protein
MVTNAIFMYGNKRKARKFFIPIQKSCSRIFFEAVLGLSPVILHGRTGDGQDFFPRFISNLERYQLHVAEKAQRKA